MMYYFITLIFINIHFAQFKARALAYVTFLIEFVVLLLPRLALIKLITPA